MKLKGLVVLITGGASGIGESLARLLICKEAIVIICDVQIEKGNLLESEFKDKLKFYPCDITSESEVENMINEIEKLYGRLDCLVNNAGVGVAELTATPNSVASKSMYDFVFGINTFGVFNITRFAAKLMLKNSQKNDSLCNGCIVMVSSVAGIEGQKGQVAYAGSKGALLGMTLPLARDLGRYKIRVNSVCPGTIETPMTAPVMDSKNIKSMIDNTPIKRPGRPIEVADTILFYIENDFLNGTQIRIDGGMRFPHF